MRSLRKLIPRDTRGSVAVSGIFAGVIAAGAMFYVVELGASAMQGIEMENSANSGAMAAASSMARVLNTVALLNVTLVALVSVVSGLKSIEALVVLAIMICAAICALCSAWGTGCWACPYEAPLNTAQQYVARVIDFIEQPINAIVRTASQVIKRLDLGFLLVAHQLARMAMAGQLDDLIAGAVVGAAVGYMFQFIPDMPFMENPCAYLCDMGGVSGGDEGWLPSFWPIRLFTSVAMAVYSGDFAGTMCGGGGGGANGAVVSETERSGPDYKQHTQGIDTARLGLASARERAADVDFGNDTSTNQGILARLNGGADAVDRFLGPGFMGQASLYFSDMTADPSEWGDNMSWTNHFEPKGILCDRGVVNAVFNQMPAQFRPTLSGNCVPGRPRLFGL